MNSTIYYYSHRKILCIPSHQMNTEGEKKEEKKEEEKKISLDLMLETAFVAKNLPEIKKQLILGANANHSIGGIPLLVCAVQIRDSEIIQMLCAYGADVDNQSAQGITPIEYAIQENQSQIAQMLFKMNPPFPIPDGKFNSTKKFVDFIRASIDMLKERVFQTNSGLLEIAVFKAHVPGINRLIFDYLTSFDRMLEKSAFKEPGKKRKPQPVLGSMMGNETLQPFKRM